MVKNNLIDNISLDGGTLCLNFVNTVHDRKTNPQPDYLFSTLDLIVWGQKASLLSNATARLIKKAALERPAGSNEFFHEAINIREMLYQVFLTLTKGRSVEKKNLKSFNDVLKKHMAAFAISSEKGFSSTWDLPKDSFQWITAPVVKDACELLLSDRLDRIKECSNCGWLFLDTTKNGKRKWCSMKACGSNVKALQWYHRNKTKQ